MLDYKKRGWPKRLCHLDVDDFIAPKAFFLDPTLKNENLEGTSHLYIFLDGLDYPPHDLTLYKKRIWMELNKSIIIKS
jgi:hypothetical protein